MDRLNGHHILVIEDDYLISASIVDELIERGATVVAVQDHSGTIVNDNGFDVLALIEHSTRNGGIAGFSGGETIDNEDFWSVDCDILIPAALEAQITAARAEKIKAKVILEGANGPTLTQADDILRQRQVLVVPDVICNAGGVTVSYFEWVQDFSSFFWDEDEINQKLERIMIDAFSRIWDMGEHYHIPLRTAAFAVACERILTARQERGLYP